MPRATVSVGDTERYELKTCPGGFVELRRMTYLEYLTRRDMSGKLTVSAQGGSKDFEGVMALANKLVTAYEFKHCIIDHNLEDETGRKLDFRHDLTLNKLDPRIGEEIGTLIDKMNQFEETSDPKEGASNSESTPPLSLIDQ